MIYQLIWTFVSSMPQFKEDERYWNGAHFSMSFGGEHGRQDAVNEMIRRLKMLDPKDVAIRGTIDFIISVIPS